MNAIVATTTQTYQLYVCVFRMTEGETTCAREAGFSACMPPPEYEYDNYFHWFVKDIHIHDNDPDYFAHIKREYDTLIRTGHIDRRRGHFKVYREPV